MVLFAAPAAADTVLDGVLTPERSQQLVTSLRGQLAAFRQETLVCRRLGRGPGETVAPVAQRLRRLRSPALGPGFADDLTSVVRRSVGQVAPRAGGASTKALSAYALEGGATLRLDLVHGSSSATGVTMTFVLRPDGGAAAVLRMWRRPWAERCGPAPPTSPALREVTLGEGQAALVPADWPVELVLPSSPPGERGPLFALVVLVGVEVGVGARGESG
jgi:hypothetical protein